MSREVPIEEFTYDMISWADIPADSNIEAWESGREMVRALLSLGKPTNILDEYKLQGSGRLIARHLPNRFAIDGFSVSFIVGSPEYHIESTNLAIPPQRGELDRGQDLMTTIKADIGHVKYLRDRDIGAIYSRRRQSS